MNNKLSIAYSILISTPLFFGCGGPIKEENENIPASTVPLGQKYMVDTSESVITWKGSMVLTPGEKHVGHVYISKGELMIEKDQIVGGTVVIDMNTIEYGDKEDQNTPVQHLKSPDYFDVEKFPISTIAITKVDSVSDKTIKVTGKLTIKDVTRTVSFPAEVEVKDGVLKANAKLVIDRTDWGIRYRSGKFYDVLADQVVSDDIEFLINIVVKK